jgi:hypothetical protein
MSREGKLVIEPHKEPLLTTHARDKRQPYQHSIKPDIQAQKPS